MKEYLEEARLIVVVAGKTGGLRWEFSQLAKHRAWGRLVLLWPPVEPEEAQQRWQRFREATGLAAEAPEALPRTVVTTFHEDTTPSFVTCACRDERCYRLALRCALAV